MGPFLLRIFSRGPVLDMPNEYGLWEIKQIAEAPDDATFHPKEFSLASSKLLQ